MTLSADKFLSQKLELTEATMNINLVNTKAKMQPDSHAEWINIKGTYALFDGTESPLTQTFGLGLSEDVTHEELAIIETFFQKHEAPVFHEISPMANPSHMAILHERGYKPVELTSVLYKVLSKDHLLQHPVHSDFTIRILRENRKRHLRTCICRRVGHREMAGISDFVYQFASIIVNSAGVYPFVGEINGNIASTAVLFIHNDVALLAGDSTIPEQRNKGAQNALLNGRLNYAADQGCTLAMICAKPGSQSQRNAEKKGFRIAYTRTKWMMEE